MNLRSIDLNLLVVMDALLEEAHVSRAAARLGLSQPAASNALERCRALFGDPLLTRRGSRMQKTAMAETLAPRIKAILADLEAVFTPPENDPAVLNASVRIATADQPAASLVPKLHRELSVSAPGICLVIQPWEGGGVPLERLRSGDCDLALCVAASTDGDIISRQVSDVRYIIAMRAGHPAASDFTTESWLAFGHLIVSSDGSVTTPLDGMLMREGLTRRAGMVVPNFLMVPDILRGTDLIAAIPSGCIPEASQDFAIFEPPIAIEGFQLHLAWHKRHYGNQAVQHVARLIAGLLE
ncbi:MAG: LysR family transcriptional regulator [Hyphomonadaceae bacterium]|jgi:DNA-binding transcriptional LysR family regulator|uniref:LysR family transcriptional regulator n=1 Tax=uncultured Henriciella sp. TaxID=1608424 RepID=UPI000C4732D3|nr:LysR family transcriptional regulator [Hyphomonadaceae bacterium]|tara:strand:- start:75 stop:965 length:891 start_codon:yes stop_codon:yes gene_type:complete